MVLGPAPGRTTTPCAPGSVRVDAEREEAARRKDAFIAGLAHELRNPLAASSMAVELLRRGDTSPAVQARSLAILGRQVANLTRLVDDLLDVTRLGHGKLALQTRAMDLTSLVRSTLEVWQMRVRAAGQSLSSSLPEGPLPMVGDPVRLEQILSNLLHNAVKFSPPSTRIQVTLHRDGGMAVLRVRDQGRGIRADVLARIFEPFSQAEECDHGAEGGLGLGLPLARNLAHLHGGELAARSEGPGRGSELELRLPLREERAAEAEGPRAEAAPTPSGERRVLVVDDNTDAAESLAELLESMGVTARCAFDGPSALVVAVELRPHVILLDLGMPGMDGYQVARRLRGMPQAASALIVALTGWGDTRSRARTEEAGFDRHLTKPVTIASLTELLEEPPNPAPGHRGTPGEPRA
jgi:CheY-like chemotaxis protein